MFTWYFSDELHCLYFSFGLLHWFLFSYIYVTLMLCKSHLINLYVHQKVVVNIFLIGLRSCVRSSRGSSLVWLTWAKKQKHHVTSNKEVSDISLRCVCYLAKYTLLWSKKCTQTHNSYTSKQNEKACHVNISW